MADEQPHSGWRWVGGIAAILAIAAFFGIHNFDQLKSWMDLNGTSGTGPSAPTVTSNTAPPCLLLYCHQVHFIETGWQAAGPCSSQSCPLTAAFQNQGGKEGSATVTLTLHFKDSDGITNEAASLGSCTAVIPDTPGHGSTMTGCTIYPTTSLDGHTMGITDFISNPIG